MAQATQLNCNWPPHQAKMPCCAQPAHLQLCLRPCRSLCKLRLALLACCGCRATKPLHLCLQQAALCPQLLRCWARAVWAVDHSISQLTLGGSQRCLLLR